MLECLLIDHAHPHPLFVALTIFCIGTAYTIWYVQYDTVHRYVL